VIWKSRPCTADIRIGGVISGYAGFNTVAVWSDLVKQKRLFFGDERINAQEALCVDLFEKVVHKGNAVKNAKNFLRKIMT